MTALADLLAAALALMLAVFLLALAGIPLLAPLMRITWPLRWLAHLLRAKFAVWRELPRARARWTHPAAR